MSVHCTTRSLCFAAGGYFGSSDLSGIVPGIQGYLDSVLLAVPPGAGAGGGTIIANVMPVAGVVVRSTNGGTFWNVRSGTFKPHRLACLIGCTRWQRGYIH